MPTNKYYIYFIKVVTFINITDVRIRRVVTHGKMKAVASVTFDDEFVVHDIKVIQGHTGCFIAMPSRKTPNGEFKDIAHSINSGAREKIQSAILERFNELSEQES